MLIYLFVKVSKKLQRISRLKKDAIPTKQALKRKYQCTATCQGPDDGASPEKMKRSSAVTKLSLRRVSINNVLNPKQL